MGEAISFVKVKKSCLGNISVNLKTKQECQKFHQKINVDSSKHNMSFHVGIPRASNGRESSGGSAHQAVFLDQCRIQSKAT